MPLVMMELFDLSNRKSWMCGTRTVGILWEVMKEVSMKLWEELESTSTRIKGMSGVDRSRYKEWVAERAAALSQASSNVQFGSTQSWLHAEVPGPLVILTALQPERLAV
jgi:hypothetical protein